MRLAASAVLIALAGATLMAGDDAQSVRSQSFPRVAGHGRVYPFPDAPGQPRDGSKICVDVTTSAESSQLHSAIEKIARYVNIYAGAGAERANAKFVVILHGGAIPVALSDEAYRQRFGGDKNPNLPLIQTLKGAGVQFFVCGQSLTAAGMQPDEVAPLIQVAVSALSMSVNCQLDGFALIPIR